MVKTRMVVTHSPALLSSFRAIVRKSLAPGLLLSVASALGLNACSGPIPSGGGLMGPATGPGGDGHWGMMGGSGMYGGRGMMMGGPMSMHGWAMAQGVPGEYAGQRNPLPDDPRVVAKGKTLYLANCAACHGASGAGDGPAANGMSPPPVDLRRVVQRPTAGDGYLMWAISDGGAAMGSAMPAFKDTLSETDRWQIIRYIEMF
jgi:mono/diheme cytochrome c family protein